MIMGNDTFIVTAMLSNQCFGVQHKIFCPDRLLGYTHCALHQDSVRAMWVETLACLSDCHPKGMLAGLWNLNYCTPWALILCTLHWVPELTVSLDACTYAPTLLNFTHADWVSESCDLTIMPSSACGMYWCADARTQAKAGINIVLKQSWLTVCYWTHWHTRGWHVGHCCGRSCGLQPIGIKWVRTQSTYMKGAILPLEHLYTYKFIKPIAHAFYATVRHSTRSLKPSWHVLFASLSSRHPQSGLLWHPLSQKAQSWLKPAVLACL